ncbi:dienelactone hydrolase family protein [Formicincola oecophyllae]|uniref:Dienelactone hydrolase family protein n=1 Tax=Formicincola oecophyllae TaxID=2558361 RepID=A0A4Y6UAG1_9PROT|nr:dienelactone hydrolase family protein [Formicincola oecophyllae]QDH13930.1 dienelactone hydrolase family protein [Formicincola oecophyllae]
MPAKNSATAAPHGQRLQLASTTGPVAGKPFEAWSATPLPGKANGAGIVVVQEIFGLTDFIKDVCQRLASQGYKVLAPALYDPIRPGIVLGYDQTGLRQGMAYRAKLPAGAALAEIGACVAALHKEGCAKVGVVGFCWGGRLAWQAAQHLPVQAVSGWYGVGIDQDLDPLPKAPVQLHYGKEDSFAPPAQRAAVRQGCPEAEIHLYEAGHGFGCTSRSDYVPAAAKLAWERTDAFFKHHLLGQSQPNS